MIAVFIFYLHFVGAVYAFAKSYVDHKTGDAFMTLAFVAIIFSVGWTIAGLIVRVAFPPQGLSAWLDPDTLSLIIVTVLEAVMYGTYFFRRRATPSVTGAGN